MLPLAISDLASQTYIYNSSVLRESVGQLASSDLVPLNAVQCGASNSRGLIFKSDPTGHLIFRWGKPLSNRDNQNDLKIVAGTGTPGFTGDGGPASSARLHTPTHITIDDNDDLYVLDDGNIRIRKIDAKTGLISTVAGNGNVGFSGDGGPATEASMYMDDIAVSQGVLYVSGGARIRIIKHGMITTIAGTGIPGFSGDGGLATSAQIVPRDLAIDRDGNVFFSDGYNSESPVWITSRIRKIDAATGIISTVAGTGRYASVEAGVAARTSVANPATLAFDGDGQLYFSSASEDGGIYKIDRDGMLSKPVTMAGTSNMVLASTGDILYSDRTVCTILRDDDDSGTTAGPHNWGSCPLSVLPASATPSGYCGENLCMAGASGRTLTVPVDVPRGVSWTASSSAPHVQVWPTSGYGPGSLTVTVFPNYSSVLRRSDLLVGTNVLSLIQTGNIGTREQRFVDLLYSTFFGRLPSAAERAFQVQHGLSKSWTTLTMDFLNSAEFNSGGRFVAGLYVGLLNRDAEYGGWLFQRNALAGGALDHTTLVQNFLQSAEYKLLYGVPSDTEFVRLLYRHILLRESTTSEVAFQASQLARLPRAALARDFLNSAEFRAGVGPRLTTFLIFATLLQREPRVEERQLLMQRLSTGRALDQIVSEFLASVEFSRGIN